MLHVRVAGHVACLPHGGVRERRRNLQRDEAHRRAVGVDATHDLRSEIGSRSPPVGTGCAVTDDGGCSRRRRGGGHDCHENSNEKERSDSAARRETMHQRYPLVCWRLLKRGRVAGLSARLHASRGGSEGLGCGSPAAHARSLGTPAVGLDLPWREDRGLRFANTASHATADPCHSRHMGYHPRPRGSTGRGIRVEVAGERVDSAPDLIRHCGDAGARQGPASPRTATG